MKKTELTKEYKETLEEIKSRVKKAQYKALVSVNKELIKLYWDIGKIILDKQEKAKWGKAIVENLARDLQVEFPGIKGFSERNVWRMRQFYEIYHDNKILTQLVSEMPWGQNIVIMNKCKDQVQREFYIKMTIKNGWSRSTLGDKIKDKEFERWALKQDNYDKKLPKSLARKAEVVNKDEYNLDFLLLEEEHKERVLEDKITENIVKFLAEMGGDFAFLGRQYPLRFSGEEFFIDLLFYHRKMKSLVAVELKAGKFDARDVGQMGLYLAALDKYERKEGENPSLGIIICKSKSREVVKLSLQFVAKPIGVATYKTYKSKSQLPKKVRKYLPSPETLKKRLSRLIKG